MAMLSLRISLEGGRVTKTIQFEPNTSVFDACRLIREKFAESVQGQPNEFGLFLSDEENKQGVWLESGRPLNYYFLHNHDVLEYRRKLRQLRVRMLDGAVKTILVDDSQPVSQLMVVICTKIGITNHEEYGLVREDKQPEIVPDNRFATLTLRKKAVDKERDTKMETLRHKLKTDDETNWVELGKTLREQGIDESEEVLLRRKFFYSDQNIDSRDPVQLNLLYVQARDAIVNGVHPVTVDKACEFAGIQAQIQFGDYNEKKHQTGFLDLKEFLPGSYSTDKKTVEKKIFAEHRKHVGLSEIDAKVEYTKTARELPTYGVTFFLVKEKLPSKNKLVPRLLGVTKDSVLRLDEKTKEILKTWPLTTVRRWGASPKTFTLDFGDYADSYYSVQTTEAEQIVQLISGYIDIILKKKKSKDHFGIEGDEGSTMVEESVEPSKATFLQHEVNRVGQINTESLAMPVIMRGSDAEKSYTHGEMQNMQYGAFVGQVNMAHQPPMTQEIRITSVLTEPQRALLSYINAGQEEISRAHEELLVREVIPPIGDDMHSIQWRENKLETAKQVVTTHIASMNAATAQVVTASQPDDIDHEAIGDAVSRITQSIPAVTKEMKMMAALMEDDQNGDKLLDAARHLCDAFSDLLKAAEPESKEPRQSLLNAASRVGEASTSLLSTIGEESPESRELHDMLLQLAKAVANTTAALVLRAKSIAASVEDEDTRNKVITAASQCALATSQLVACAKVVAPTLQNKACRDQLEAAAREVAKAVSNLVETCKFATDDEKLKGDLMGAAHEVSKTLRDLLDHINLSARERVTERIEENPMENVIISSDLLISSTDPNEMMRQAHILSQATAQLIQSIKGEADDENDSETQNRLMAAAKQLADATARLLEAARVCSSNPMDHNNQEALRVAAEELREITSTSANTPAIKRRLINRLEQSAKHAASAATQCIQASRNAVQHSSDKEAIEALLQDCGATADTIPRLVSSIKMTISNPDDPSAQLGLIDASETFIEVGTNTTSSARSLQPSIGDNHALQQLAKTTHNFTQTLHDLRSASTRAREACGGGELESALDAVSNLRNVLNDTRKAADASALRPLPGETPESTAKNLGATTKGVGQAITYFTSTVTHGNRAYAGAAGRDTALALGEFTRSVRGVAATNNSTTVIDFADGVIVNSMRVIEEAQRVMQNFGDANQLSQATRELHTSLTRTVDCLPGQREVDESLRTVSELSEVISMGEFPPSNKNYGALQTDLKTAAENLNRAGGRIVQAHASPAQLASTSQEYTDSYKELLTTSLELAGQTTDDAARNNVVVSIRGVSRASCALLSTAKSVAADPEQPNNKAMLANAARAVTESINYLVDMCTSAAPGQKECDKAIRCIEGLRPLLDNPREAVNDLSYYDCYEAATEKSAHLGHAISEMINHAKGSQYVEFGHSVNMVAESIRGLIESAAQSAYLVGVSDPSSVAGRPGLIDTAQLMRVSQSIEQHCDILRNPDSSREQLISALTTIAKQTTHLCNISRNASTNTSNPVAKQQFIYAAKDVATATSVLVHKSKNLDKDYDNARVDCAEATRPLLEAVNACRQFASSPEYVSIPAKISEAGWKAQEPILDAGRGVLDGVIEMVRTVKSLAVTPDNPPVWQQLAIHSKPVSEGVKRLVDNIRNKAPGKVQCDEALSNLSSCARELDSTALSIGIQGLAPRKENNLQGFTNQTLNSASEIIDKLDTVRAAAKKNAESLGHAVSQMCRHAIPLTNGAIGACSHLIHSSQQITLLDQSKSVVESMQELIQTAKESGGNPRATNLHAAVDECVSMTREALTDLQATVEKLSTENGVVTGLMEQISRSITKLTDKRQSLMGVNINDSFVDYQTRMVQSAKEIARLSNEINARAPADMSRLPQLCVDITHHYAQLAQDSMGASATINSPDVSIRIKNTVQELGHALIALVQSTAGLRPEDPRGLAEVTRNTKNVTEKVSQVLAALQAGSRGTQACINAANTVSGIIGDLDTTIMFATAGTLNAGDNENFADHRENILKTAKALVEDTKVLVAGAAGTQDELAGAAQNAVATILQLAEAVKRGASSLGSSQPDSQVMTINAVKDVASALGELINATKLASGKPIHDPAMNDMKESARVMVLNVSNLLKTVKAVEDEHTRGTRAMESTVEAISQEIRTMNAPMSPNAPQLGPEELIRVTKNVTVATAKAVAAGTSNSQNDIVAAANIGRKAISEMLFVCKSVAFTCAETAELRQRTLDAGVSIAVSYRDLLDGVLKGCSADERMHLSRRVAKCVTDLVAMAQLLKGSDWVDPEDPTVIAENELLGAAASIDAAAKKLANLRPRRNDVPEADENMKFDEMILEAARGIMAASSALVRAANAAQRDLIDQGKVARRPLTSSDDGQWSEGLISAARLVAAATHTLVEAAQNLVTGVDTEEKLISSAKQVAATTAQLLIACKVKSDPNSESGRRLQTAGNAVIKSTDNLVRAAQRAIDMEEEHILKINTSMVDGMAQEINAQSEVLKMERELEAARNKLVAIRQAKYRAKAIAGMTTDESDGEYYGPPPPQTTNQYGYHSPQSYATPSQQQQMQRQQQQYGSLNRQVGPLNATPASPSFLNTSSSTAYQGQGGPPPTSPRPHLLTGNAIPRPYNTASSPDSSLPQSPIMARAYNNSRTGPPVPPPPAMMSQVKSNLEACVKDLHEKTFGQSSSPMSTFKASPSKFTTYQSPYEQNQSFETHTYGTSGLGVTGKAPPPPPPPKNYNRDYTTTRTVTNNTTTSSAGGEFPGAGGNGSLAAFEGGVNGSDRLNSMQQRMMKREVVTTTSETKSEHSSKMHNFRME